MNCRQFDKRVDQLLAGACTSEAWREAEAHVASCERCRRVFAALSGTLDGGCDADQRELTDAILAATTGGSCGAARDRLGDYVDLALEPFDRSLVESHLAHCQACSALAAAMAQTAEWLPTFAEVDPPASFSERVIGVTTGATPVPVRWRLAAWAERLASRPRIAFEAAYVGTFLVMLLIGNPVAAFRDTSSRAAIVAAPRVQQVIQQVAGPLESARALGNETVRTAAAMAQPPDAPPSWWSSTIDLVRHWWASGVEAPIRALLDGLSGVANSLKRGWEEIRRGAPSAGPGARRTAATPTEPSSIPARLCL